MQTYLFPIISFIFFASIHAIEDNTDQENYKPERFMVNGDLEIKGTIIAALLEAETMLNKDIVNCSQTVSTNKLKADVGKVDTIITKVIKAKDNVLVIKSDLSLHHNLTTQTLKAPSLILKDQKQWSLLKHEDFEDQSLMKDWNPRQLTHVKNDQNILLNTFLGGHCKTSSQPILKTYKDLPFHSFLKINAKYHMFDNWNGEYGYLKVDDKMVWTSTSKASKNKNAINIGGGPAADPKYNMLIDITIPHEENMIKLEFGSSLKGDPCNASYGIDDIMLFAKQIKINQKRIINYSRKVYTMCYILITREFTLKKILSFIILDSFIKHLLQIHFFAFIQYISYYELCQNLNISSSKMHKTLIF